MLRCCGVQITSRTLISLSVTVSDLTPGRVVCCLRPLASQVSVAARHPLQPRCSNCTRSALPLEGLHQLSATGVHLWQQLRLRRPRPGVQTRVNQGFEIQFVAWQAQ